MHDQKSSENSPNLGKRLLTALSQQEVAQLLDTLFGVILPELQEQAIAQLSPDTQQTVQQLLDFTQNDESTPTVSLAKQAQILSNRYSMDTRNIASGYNSRLL